MATAKKSAGFKIPNSRQILPSIEKGELKPLYLFLGEEAGEKEAFIDKIAGHFFKGSPPQISRFHASSGDLLGAAAFAIESSMFSEKKITVILEVESVNSKRDISLLEDIAREQPENSIVIMSSSENSIPKSLAGCSGEIQPVIFWRMFESEIQNHIIKKFSASGRHIDTHAAARIVSLTGRDLHKADDAVDRIIAGSEGSINEKTVVSLIADEREITVFEFIEAFFRKRKDTLSLLKKVLDEGGNELGIIALMLREAERIESYHTMRLAGKNHEDAVSELHINPRNIEDFSRMVQTISRKQIRNLFILLSRADKAAKSSRLSPSVLASPLAETITEFFGKKFERTAD